MKIHLRLSRFAPCVLLFLAAACAGDPTGRGGERSGELRFDLQPLQAQAGRSVSVLDRLVLHVEPTGAAAQRIEREVALSEGPVSFPVTVLEGDVVFRVEILSNNATVLFSGEARSDVRQDGFAIQVPVTQRAPFLVVEPDTVVLATVGGDFFVRNLGSDAALGDVVWRIDGEPQPVQSCWQAPWLSFASESGRIAIGASGTLHFGRLTAARGSACTLRIASQVGHVEVVVRVP